MSRVEMAAASESYPPLRGSQVAQQGPSQFCSNTGTQPRRPIGTAAMLLTVRKETLTPNRPQQWPQQPLDAAVTTLVPLLLQELASMGLGCQCSALPSSVQILLQFSPRQTTWVLLRWWSTPHFWVVMRPSQLTQMWTGKETHLSKSDLSVGRTHVRWLCICLHILIFFTVLKNETYYKVTKKKEIRFKSLSVE